MDENKEKWYDDMLQYLAEDIRETKNLVKETRELVIVAKEEAKAATVQAKAAWELVMITRNEYNRPWWKKLFGIKA